MELAKLKKQRATLKRRITLFSTFVESADPIVDQDEVSIRLTQIESILTEFETIQMEIELQEDIPENEIYTNEFEQSFYAVLRKARKFLKDNIPGLIEGGKYTVDGIVNSTSVESNVRRPKIELPSFNGSYDKWMCFYDTFKTMVHNKGHISKIEKLHYLRSCLKDDAATVTQSLETTEGNYDIAWSLLIERYDNKRVIIQNHLKALLEQPPFTRESVANVRQILDSINKHTRALKALGQPVDTWDTILIYLMTAKLDKTTHQEWEKSIVTKNLPTVEQFIAFLTSRCQILEATSVQPIAQNAQGNSTTKNSIHTPKRVLTVAQRPEFCNFCKGAHKINNCEGFLKLTPSERLNSIKSIRACFNCLRKNHTNEQCTCGPCKKCGKKHHTLLHLDRQNTTIVEPSVSCGSLQITAISSIPKVAPENEQVASVAPTISLSCGHLQTDCSSQIVLATAKIAFTDAHNKKHTARVVLDAGAQAHFISEKMANLLKLKRAKTYIPVVAINNLETTIRHKVTTKIASLCSKFESEISLLVVPEVSASLPSLQINTQRLNIPKNLPLADPSYYKPSEIDALIGAELFFKTLCAKQLEIQNEEAILQKTRFGWVVAGKIKNDEPASQNIVCNFTRSTTSSDMSRFWEIEELPETKFLSIEEAEVEQHFLNNVTRDDTGRYTVRIPFNNKISELGDTYNIALRRFLALERKLEKAPQLKSQYIDFMREYEQLKHMSHLEKYNLGGCFLPHHAVLKNESATTKSRTVFDGSAEPVTGVSLNAAQRVGPTIQSDVFALTVRFRMHEIVLVADIEKMYRQILIHPEDRKFQKIIWRENSNQQLKIYNLNTVTYGTSSAPFLAIRTLHKLAEDEKEMYPLASEIVKRDFYVDDLLTGSDTVENAIQLRDDLQNLLKSGGFNLRQWSSNDHRVIESLPSETTNKDLFKHPSRSIKTLGIRWKSQQDILLYSLEPDHMQEKITKRTILSKIAQLFDPIGLLGPIIVKAKLIMQRLWKAKVDWDEVLPLNINSEWMDYKNQLTNLSKVTFQRRILISNPVNIQLHGFCDASEVAYGACIYIRSIDKDSNCITRLVCAKSKVAPLNSKLTIPKLELCAALLLSNLYKAILNSRPLTPLSNDPNDFIALTPANFLINDSLMSIPDVAVSDIPTNRLSNWEHLQRLRQHFWERWHKEYLNELNTRSKWSSPNSDPVAVGAMVLLKESHTPPLQWPLGRIVEVHPGTDGVVRVISVKTKGGIYKRAVKKVAILPIETLNN